MNEEEEKFLDNLYTTLMKTTDNFTKQGSCLLNSPRALNLETPEIPIVKHDVQYTDEIENCLEQKIGKGKIIFFLMEGHIVYFPSK